MIPLSQWTRLPAGLRSYAATTWDIIIPLTLFCQPGIFILLRCNSQSVLKAPALHHNLCQESHSVKIQCFSSCLNHCLEGFLSIIKWCVSALPVIKACLQSALTGKTLKWFSVTKHRWYVNANELFKTYGCKISLKLPTTLLTFKLIPACEWNPPRLSVSCFVFQN